MEKLIDVDVHLHPKHLPKPIQDIAKKTTSHLRVATLNHCQKVNWGDSSILSGKSPMFDTVKPQYVIFEDRGPGAIDAPQPRRTLRDQDVRETLIVNDPYTPLLNGYPVLPPREAVRDAPWALRYVTILGEPQETREENFKVFMKEFIREATEFALVLVRKTSLADLLPESGGPLVSAKYSSGTSLITHRPRREVDGAGLPINFSGTTLDPGMQGAINPFMVTSGIQAAAAAAASTKEGADGKPTNTSATPSEGSASTGTSRRESKAGGTDVAALPAEDDDDANCDDGGGGGGTRGSDPAKTDEPGGVGVGTSTTGTKNDKSGKDGKKTSATTAKKKDHHHPHPKSSILHAAGVNSSPAHDKNLESAPRPALYYHNGIGFEVCNNRTTVSMLGSHENAFKYAGQRFHGLAAISRQDIAFLHHLPAILVEYAGYRVWCSVLPPTDDDVSPVVYGSRCAGAAVPHHIAVQQQQQQQQQQANSGTAAGGGAASPISVTTPSSSTTLPSSSSTAFANTKPDPFKRSDAQALACLRELSTRLNLKPHHCGTAAGRQFLYTNGDLCVQRAMDNRLYITSGTERLLPPVTTNNFMFPNGYLYRRFRLELIVNSKKNRDTFMPISADAFSNLGVIRAEEHDREASMLTEILKSHVLNDAIHKILHLLMKVRTVQHGFDLLRVKGGLSALLHRFGVNVRYIGEMVTRLSQRYYRIRAKQSGADRAEFMLPIAVLVIILRTEMIARALKYIVRRLLRNRSLVCIPMLLVGALRVLPLLKTDEEEEEGEEGKEKKEGEGGGADGKDKEGGDKDKASLVAAKPAAKKAAAAASPLGGGRYGGGKKPLGKISGKGGAKGKTTTSGADIGNMISNRGKDEELYLECFDRVVWPVIEGKFGRDENFGLMSFHPRTISIFSQLDEGAFNVEYILEHICTKTGLCFVRLSAASLFSRYAGNLADKKAAEGKGKIDAAGSASSGSPLTGGGGGASSPGSGASPLGGPAAASLAEPLPLKDVVREITDTRLGTSLHTTFAASDPFPVVRALELPPCIFPNGETAHILGVARSYVSAISIAIQFRHLRRPETQVLKDLAYNCSQFCTMMQLTSDETVNQFISNYEALMAAVAASSNSKNSKLKAMAGGAGSSSSNGGLLLEGGASKAGGGGTDAEELEAILTLGPNTIVYPTFRHEVVKINTDNEKISQVFPHYFHGQRLVINSKKIEGLVAHAEEVEASGGRTPSSKSPALSSLAPTKTNPATAPNKGGTVTVPPPSSSTPIAPSASASSPRHPAGFVPKMVVLVLGLVDGYLYVTEEPEATSTWNEYKRIKMWREQKEREAEEKLRRSQSKKSFRKKSVAPSAGGTATFMEDSSDESYSDDDDIEDEAAAALKAPTVTSSITPTTKSLMPPPPSSNKKSSGSGSGDHEPHATGVAFPLLGKNEEQVLALEGVEPYIIEPGYLAAPPPPPPKTTTSSSGSSEHKKKDHHSHHHPEFFLSPSEQTHHVYTVAKYDYGELLFTLGISMPKLLQQERDAAKRRRDEEAAKKRGKSPFSGGTAQLSQQQEFSLSSLKLGSSSPTTKAAAEKADKDGSAGSATAAVLFKRRQQKTAGGDSFFDEDDDDDNENEEENTSQSNSSSLNNQKNLFLVQKFGYIYFFGPKWSIVRYRIIDEALEAFRPGLRAGQRVLSPSSGSTFRVIGEASGHIWVCQERVDALPRRLSPVELQEVRIVHNLPPLSYSDEKLNFQGKRYTRQASLLANYGLYFGHKVAFTRGPLTGMIGIVLGICDEQLQLFNMKSREIFAIPGRNKKELFDEHRPVLIGAVLDLEVFHPMEPTLLEIGTANGDKIIVDHRGGTLLPKYGVLHGCKVEVVKGRFVQHHCVVYGSALDRLWVKLLGVPGSSGGATTTGGGGADGDGGGVATAAAVASSSSSKKSRKGNKNNDDDNNNNNPFRFLGAIPLRRDEYRALSDEVPQELIGGKPKTQTKALSVTTGGEGADGKPSSPSGGEDDLAQLQLGGLDPADIAAFLRHRRSLLAAQAAGKNQGLEHKPEPFLYLSGFGLPLIFDKSDVLCGRFGIFHGQRITIAKDLFDTWKRYTVIGMFQNELWAVEDGSAAAVPLLGVNATEMLQIYSVCDVIGHQYVRPFQDFLAIEGTNITPSTRYFLSSHDHLASIITEDLDFLGVDTTKEEIQIQCKTPIPVQGGDRIEVIFERTCYNRRVPDNFGPGRNLMSVVDKGGPRHEEEKEKDEEHNDEEGVDDDDGPQFRDGLYPIKASLLERAQARANSPPFKYKPNADSKHPDALRRDIWEWKKKSSFYIVVGCFEGVLYGRRESEMKCVILEPKLMALAVIVSHNHPIPHCTMDDLLELRAQHHQLNTVVPSQAKSLRELKLLYPQVKNEDEEIWKYETFVEPNTVKRMIEKFNGDYPKHSSRLVLHWVLNWFNCGLKFQEKLNDGCKKLAIIEQFVLQRPIELPTVAEYQAYRQVESMRKEDAERQLRIAPDRYQEIKEAAYSFTFDNVKDGHRAARALRTLPGLRKLQPVEEIPASLLKSAARRQSRKSMVASSLLSPMRRKSRFGNNQGSGDDEVDPNLPRGSSPNERDPSSPLTTEAEQQALSNKLAVMKLRSKVTKATGIKGAGVEANPFKEVVNVAMQKKSEAEEREMAKIDLEEEEEEGVEGADQDVPPGLGGEDPESHHNLAEGGESAFNEKQPDEKDAQQETADGDGEEGSPRTGTSTTASAASPLVAPRGNKLKEKKSRRVLQGISFKEKGGQEDEGGKKEGGGGVTSDRDEDDQQNEDGDGEGDDAAAAAEGGSTAAAASPVRKMSTLTASTQANAAAAAAAQEAAAVIPFWVQNPEYIINISLQRGLKELESARFVAVKDLALELSQKAEEEKQRKLMASSSTYSNNNTARSSSTSDHNNADNKDTNEGEEEGKKSSTNSTSSTIGKHPVTRFRYKTVEGATIYFESSDRACYNVFGMRRGDVYRYTETDMEGVHFVILGVYKKQLWRYEETFTGSSPVIEERACPFMGKNYAEITSIHCIEKVQERFARIRESDPFYFPKFEGRLQLFDTTEQACMKHNVIHGRRYLCRRPIPDMLYPWPNQTHGPIITAIGSDGENTFFASDESGAFAIQSINPIKDLDLEPLYTTTVLSFSTKNSHWFRCPIEFASRGGRRQHVTMVNCDTNSELLALWGRFVRHGALVKYRGVAPSHHHHYRGGGANPNNSNNLSTSVGGPGGGGGGVDSLNVTQNLNQSSFNQSQSLNATIKESLPQLFSVGHTPGYRRFGFDIILGVRCGQLLRISLDEEVASLMDPRDAERMVPYISAEEEAAAAWMHHHSAAENVDDSGEKKDNEKEGHHEDEENNRFRGVHPLDRPYFPPGMAAAAASASSSKGGKKKKNNRTATTSSSSGGGAKDSKEGAAAAALDEDGNPIIVQREVTIREKIQQHLQYISTDAVIAAIRQRNPILVSQGVTGFTVPPRGKIKALNGFNQLCLFDCTDEVLGTLFSGIQSGDVIYFDSGTGFANKKCIVYGVRNELLWKVDITAEDERLDEEMNKEIQSEQDYIASMAKLREISEASEKMLSTSGSDHDDEKDDESVVGTANDDDRKRRSVTLLEGGSSAKNTDSAHGGSDNKLVSSAIAKIIAKYTQKRQQEKFIIASMFLHCHNRYDLERQFKIVISGKKVVISFTG